MLGKSLTEVIHETAKNIYESGAMSEKTMCEFDAMSLSNSILCYGEKIWFLVKRR